MTQRRSIGIGVVTLAVVAAMGASVGSAPPSEAATLFDPGNTMNSLPPLGWNSYNIFGGTFFPEMEDCSLPQCIPLNEARVKGIAEAMISSGLKDKGYTYINIDDRWQDPRQPRGTDGRLQSDARRFPSGIPALAQWLHDRGLKLGLYVLPNDRPCGGQEGPTNKPDWPAGLPETGSMGHEYLDAQTFADWGADYLKFDWCGVNESNRGGQAGPVFKLWNEAIAASGRNMLVAASTWGWEAENTWGPSYAHTWRIDSDVYPLWGDIMRTLDKGSTSALRMASGPAKGWNDFDTMQVGNRGLSAEENRTHFIMWAMSNSPLMLGNDLRSMTNETKNLIANDEIIAVNQDPLGEQAWLANSSNGLQVWARSLQDGTKAVALLNRTDAAANMQVNFADVYLGSNVGAVRNLYERSDKGSFTGSYSATVAPHDTVVLKISTAQTAELESAALAGGARVQACATCSGGSNVGYVGGGSGTASLTVSAAAAGPRTLNLFYSSGDTRAVYLSVNGAAPIAITSLNSGGWTTVASRSVGITLEAGPNTLVFSNPEVNGWAPDLDRITLTAAT